MAAQGNAPVIIKRKKVVNGGGHHGGAWKVAYADFVTAMMAFFLLMWLLGATTEKQRKSIADYFNPTVPIVKASGGGSGAFNGESMFSSNAMSRNSSGASTTNVSEAELSAGSADSSFEEGQAADLVATGRALKEEDLEEVHNALLGIGGESMENELLRRHIVTRISDEGLVIELFDTEEASLFDAAGEPAPLLREILRNIAPILELVDNDIAAQAHARSVPIVVREDPTWTTTTERAGHLRTSLEQAGVDGHRIARVTGFADRQPATKNPMDPRNDRLEIVVLRNRT